LDRAVEDFPRSINIFIASDASGGGTGYLGYAYVGGSYTLPYTGHIFLSWDTVSGGGLNSLLQYNSGPVILWHELGHHLGLIHPFGSTNDQAGSNSCDDDDYVTDTPTAFGA
jgi:hypothetical protein